MINWINKIIELTEQISEDVYMRKQNEVSQKYLQLLDAFGAFAAGMQELGYSVNLNEELLKLQEFYGKKDYIAFSDVLLYDIKPEFEELKETFSNN